MQTTSCTWPYVVPVGEDPAAHGHWCAFTDLYHAMPCHTTPCHPVLVAEFSPAAGNAVTLVRCFGCLGAPGPAHAAARQAWP